MESKMQAVLLTKDFKLDMVTKEIPKPSATQVRIQLAACALNRRDYWITQKMYPKVKVRKEGGRPVAGGFWFWSPRALGFEACADTKKMRL